MQDPHNMNHNETTKAIQASEYDPSEAVTIYPTSPLQQGMLFNSMYASEPGIDIIQIVCSLHENLKVSAFQQAWRDIATRHSVLRTAFRWEESAQPSQEVYAQVIFPFHHEDWQNLSKQAQRDRLEEFLLADRQQGFIFWEAPLLRLALFKLAETEYQFILTFHHAIMDGRSFPLIIKEAFDIYSALCDAQTLTLPPTHPYHEYVSQLQTTDSTADEHFWNGLLTDFTTPTPLPISSEQQVNFNPGTYHAEQDRILPVTLSQALHRLAKAQNTTLNAVLQGAWAFVLSCHSRQTDIVFGTIRSCRWGSVEKTEPVLGLFLNTLPVRIMIQKDQLLLDWFRDIRAQWLAVRAHQLTPLAQIQQWSQIPGGIPLFESIFIFENRNLHNVLQAYGGPWQDRDFRVYRKPSYPLALYAFSEPEISLTCVYERRRFSSSTVARLLEHMQDILESIVNNPYQHLDALPQLPASDLELLLKRWNATNQVYPHEACVHQLIEAHARQIPNNLAIQYGKQQLSYRQLNERANQIASLLRSFDVETDQLIGIYLDRSPEVIISQLSILKAGGAFLTFDPLTPSERLNFMIEDARIKVILTSQEYRNNLPSHLTIIALDTSEEILSNLRTEDLDLQINSANLAYSIYTSGSSGRPKGVEIQHRSLVNLAIWHDQTFQVQPSDRVSHLAALIFDASVWEIWSNLAAGASLHIPEQDILLDPHQTINWLTEQEISIAFLPTILAETVLTEQWPRQSVLRMLGIGGDRLTRGAAAEASFGVYNLYGPTECTVIAAWAKVEPIKHITPPPIGRPTANTEIYLLDEQYRPVPIGAIGELYIGGDGLARGYLNRPELTAERFIPHLFSSRPGARLYQSGDLARYRPDGTIECLGRVDQQVKIRGFRIELGEIEATLNQHPAVSIAIVQIRENEYHEKQLVAYLVAEKQEQIDKIEIRRFLSKKLPEYMIPGIMMILEGFPLTLGGKVDRNALPAPEAHEAPYEAPRTELEKTLATIWIHVLHINDEQIQTLSIHDNFFELGGHSLLAAQVILRINKLLGSCLPIRTIFDAPTLATFATCIEQIQRS